MSSGRIEETCREWVRAKHNRCGERAEFIIWGKYFPADAFGPRCYDHTAEHLHDMSALNIEQTAVYDLRRVYRLQADYRTLWGMTFGHDGQPPTEGTADDIERLRQHLTDPNGEPQ